MAFAKNFKTHFILIYNLGQLHKIDNIIIIIFILALMEWSYRE